MRESARRGEFKILYVHKVDRLARRLEWSLEIFHELQSLDINFKAVQQPLQPASTAQSCQPFVAWRLEWVSGVVDRLWPDGVPQIRNEHGSASETVFVSPVTGYTHDEACNLVYLGMVGHKTVLESIRARIQARPRKKLFLQGRLVYPLVSHYCQTWQHLPDYGAYHTTLIADPALPGKWQVGYIVQLDEIGWKEVVIRFLKERKFRLSSD